MKKPGSLKAALFILFLLATASPLGAAVESQTSTDDRSSRDRSSAGFDYKKTIPYIAVGLAAVILIIAVAARSRVVSASKTTTGGGTVPQAGNQPARPSSAGPSASFRLTIEDVFAIMGHGTVVTGRVESGDCAVGDDVHIQGGPGAIRTKIKGIEMFRKTMNTARAGDNVGLLLDGIDKGQVAKGMVITRA